MKGKRMRRLVLGWLLLVLTVLFAGPASAHFNLNQNVRIYHVVHGTDGLDVLVRTPMPFLVAGLVGPPDADGLPAPAPFTLNRLEDDQVMHLVALEALRADPLGLGRIMAETLHIATEEGRLPAEVIAVRLYPLGEEPGFATRAEAEWALAGGPVWPSASGTRYVGDVVADLHLRLNATSEVGRYAIADLSDPGLPGQDATANLVLDYNGDTTRTFRATGLMHAPLQISGSATAAVSTFVSEGIRHILEGADHLLFVLCLILGATSLASLTARITGFTTGHSVTLALGFFGIAPQGAWFIPAVETAIALSIVYAAAAAILARGSDRAADLRVLAVTAGIGLLHGFGFSFMLHEILRVDAPNVWQSLFAFNVGVEIGQLAIVAFAWPLFFFIRQLSETFWRVGRLSAASACIAVAGLWTAQRALSVVQTSWGG